MPAEKKVNNNELELVLQKRASKRSYVFDYYASVRDSISKKNDLFGQGGSLSMDIEDAKIRAIGEAIERYCGSHVNNYIIMSSYKDIENAVNPQDLIFFSKKQYNKNFPYKQFKERTSIEWVEGLSLIDGQKVKVPAFSIYLGYNRNVSKDNHFMPNSSCGLASHKSIADATRSAVFEIIERDASMGAWFREREVLRLDVESIRSGKIFSLKKQILDEGLNFEVGIVSNPYSILSVMAVIFCKNKKIPYASFGMAAGDDVEKVIIKSLEEALMVRGTLELLLQKKKISKISKKNVEKFIDHAIYYSFPENRKYWEFLFNGPSISIKELKSEYKSIKTEEIIKLFKKKNQNLISINLTPEFIKNMGFYCVRVIATKMYSMDSSYKNRFKYNSNNHIHPFS